jgi:hypothetical protein
MTTFIKQAAYAEDQPYSHAILTWHVLRSGAAAGALGSIPFALGFQFFSKSQTPLLQKLLLSSARGVIGTVGLSFIALHGRMWGREEIEWQDRSWRLLSNKGQVEVDNYVLGGAAAGALAAIVAARRGILPVEMQSRMISSIIGGAGLGMAAGTVSYMGYRYGVKGGKWEDAVQAAEEGGKATAEGIKKRVS